MRNRQHALISALLFGFLEEPYTSESAAYRAAWDHFRGYDKRCTLKAFKLEASAIEKVSIGNFIREENHATR